MGQVHRIADDDEEAAVDTRRPFIPWTQQTDGEIIRNAPMVRRIRPDTKPGKLRMLSVGDAYHDRTTIGASAVVRRNTRAAWARAGRELGITVQTASADDGSLWIYRRK